MPTISCTSRLAAVGPTQPASFTGTTVAELLASSQLEFPKLQNYVLDDQGRVRKHVAIFVDGQLYPRHSVLQQALNSESEVHIMQALSGG